MAAREVDQGVKRRPAPIKDLDVEGDDSDIAREHKRKKPQGKKLPSITIGPDAIDDMYPDIPLEFIRDLEARYGV